MNNNFSPSKELARLKKIRRIKYQQRHGKSRLDSYKGQILALKLEGATATMIQDFLREKRIKVVLSTVTRWINKNG